MIGLGTDAKDAKDTKEQAHRPRVALALGASLDFIDLEAGDRATELWALTGNNFVTYGFLLSEKGRTYLPGGAVYDTSSWRPRENATPVIGKIDPYLMREIELAELTARWTGIRYFPIVMCGVCSALVALDEKSGTATVYKQPTHSEEPLRDGWRYEHDRLEAVLDYVAAIPNQSHDERLDRTALALERKACVTVFVNDEQWSAARHDGERVLELWTLCEPRYGTRSFATTSNGRTLLD